MSDANAKIAPDAEPQRLEAPTLKKTPAPKDAPAAARDGLLWALARRVRNIWAAELDLGRIGFAISVPVICWVFYTTSSGMVDIMQKEAGDWIGLIGTVVATTAVLVMLTTTSWSLGADLAALIARRRMARERVIVKTLVTAAVFVFVFSISAFFSFTYYYNNIFKLSSKQISAELQPMELAVDILLPTAKAIGEKYDEVSARIAATPAYKEYLDQLDSLIDAARKAGPSLRDAVRKKQEEQQRVSSQAAQQAAADLQDAQEASRQLEENRDRFAGLERTAANLDAIMKAKQNEIASLSETARQEEQLAIDASKGLDGLGASCGPNCLSHRHKAADALKRAATIRETLAAPSAERASAIKQRDMLGAQAISLKQKAESAAAESKRPLPKVETAPDLDSLLRELAGLRDPMRTDPNWRGIRLARPLCESILAAERQAGAAPTSVASDFACEPMGADIHDMLAARDEHIVGRAAFDQRCALEGALRDDISAIAARIRSAQITDPAAGAKGFNDAKKLVDACVVAGKAAGLSEIDVREFLKKSDAFLRGHSTERNKFELAREAFWSFTPDSTMAICVAAAQDAFVFIMKFLSEILKRGFEARERRQFGAPMDLTDGETEPTETRAMKALMRAATPVHGEMSEIDPDAPTIAALPISVRENLIAMLNRLVRDEIAHVDRKGFYAVDNVTIAQIESRLFAGHKPRWSARLRTPSADGRGQDQQADGPKRYYGDSSGEAKRRRRPSALERYMIQDSAQTDAGDAALRS